MSIKHDEPCCCGEVPFDFTISIGTGSCHATIRPPEGIRISDGEYDVTISGECDAVAQVWHLLMKSNLLITVRPTAAASGGR